MTVASKGYENHETNGILAAITEKGQEMETKLVLQISRYSNRPRGVVGNASESRARCPGFKTRSGHLLPFLLPLVISY